MTKASAFCRSRTARPGLFLLLVFMFGCSSIPPQTERPVPAVAKQESIPEIKAQSQSQPAETSNAAEKKALAGVDAQNSIFFPLGSSTISPREKEKLLLAAHRLKSDKGLYVTLVGHANDNGSRSLNLAVADARVQSVSSILRKLGVKTLQIKKKVIGGEKTPSACQSVECRRKMRRVELVFSTGT